MSGYWVALLLAVGANILANTALKLAVRDVTTPIDARALLGLASAPWAWIGVASAAALLVLYLIAIRGIDLGIAYPAVTGLAMAGIVVAGCAVFSEPLGLQKVIGVGLVFAGVVLLAHTRSA